MKFYSLILTLTLITCSSNKKITLQTQNLYSFKIASQPIINRVELTSKEYNFLENIADTLLKDKDLMVNILSYRQSGNYDYKSSEHCSITEEAQRFLISKGIAPKRITFYWGRADFDNQIGHLHIARGSSSEPCILEIQIYYPKK